LRAVTAATTAVHHGVSAGPIVAALGIAAAAVVAVVIVLSYTLSVRTRNGAAEHRGDSRRTRPRTAPLDVDPGISANPSRQLPTG
jgi:hypothetical protein